MLECVVRAFCFIFPLHFGCYVIAIYEMFFWAVYLVPVWLHAACFPPEVWWVVVRSAGGAALLSVVGSGVLLYGLCHEAPRWTFVTYLCIHNVTVLYALVTGYLLVHSVSVEVADCPPQYAVAALHLLQIALQYYGLTCVHSYLLQLEMTDQPQ